MRTVNIGQAWVKHWEPKAPSVADIARLLVSLKADIDDDFRCSDDPDDDKPGMQVTIGADDNGTWNYQTGDTQFTGGAYGHKHWGIAYLYRNSNCRELARGVVEEIKDSQAEARAEDRY
jgi:hypothetical protein